MVYSDSGVGTKFKKPGGKLKGMVSQRKSWRRIAYAAGNRMDEQDRAAAEEGNHSKQTFCV